MNWTITEVLMLLVVVFIIGVLTADKLLSWIGF